MLYATTGDATESGNSPDPDSLGGKVLRVTPTGEVPPDNPTPGSPVYSLGHRNGQGIAWDDDGRLWQAEFGQDEWDELNLIRPGADYGWPECEGTCGDSGVVDPLAQWSHRRGLAVRHRLRRRRRLDGCAARRAAVADPGERRPRGRRADATSSPVSTAGCAP